MMTLAEMKEILMLTKYTDEPRVRTKRQLVYATLQLQSIKSKGLTDKKLKLMLDVLKLSKQLQMQIEEDEE